MLVGKFIALPVLFALVTLSSGAEIKRERREATFGSLVGGLASPFINFKRGVLNLLGGSSGQKEKKPAPPQPQAAKPSYGAPKPSYNAPAPSYNAPAPSYNAPAPSYNAPAPSYNAPAPSYNAPAPSYNAPAQSYVEPAPAYEPPAPKPEIQILPAPDLSQYAPAAAPAVDTYGSPEAAPSVDTYDSPAPAPAVDTYGSPAAAPAVDTYGSPAAAPAVDTYGSPASTPAVDTYGSPSLASYNVPAVSPAVETYDSAPVISYDYPEIPEASAPAVDSYGSPVVQSYVVEEVVSEAPALPPVYEPATYDPAPVDVPENTVAGVVTVKGGSTETDETIAGLVDTKEVVDLRQDEARAPKAFNDNQNSFNEFQTVDEKPEEEILVIDLTDPVLEIDVALNDNEVAAANAVINEEIVVKDDNRNEQLPSQVITFGAAEEIPAISGPIKSSNEVITFALQPNSEVRTIDFTAVKDNVKVDTFTAAPLVNLVGGTFETQTTVSEEDSAEEFQSEQVTPIVPNEELRSVVVELDSVPLEIAEIEAVDLNDVEVIDLRTDKKSSGLTVIDHDEDHPELIVVVDETTAQPKVPEATTLPEEELSIDVSAEVETENIVEDSITTKEPEIRRVTFEILSEEEAKNIQPEVTFRIVDGSDADESSIDTFRIQDSSTEPIEEEISVDTSASIDGVPPAIGADPVFQEIVKTSEDSENVKRGFNAYDPRHSRVYAHKYNDKYSNWYYFRKGY